MSNELEVKQDKSPVISGAGLAAIAPQDIDQAYRLSQALARSGEMVPQNFQGKPDQIMAAILRGMEVGLAPMQALNSIAVINGKACIWGDALPALMQKQNHHVEVVMQGEGDNLKAVATLTRGDTGKETVREFSIADAKKAGLLNKKGPWQTYPKRMLQMRARSWAIRDGASDALMGLQVAEEVKDYQPIRDVTPDQPSSKFQQVVQDARAAKKEDPIEQEETIEAEILDEQPAFDTSAFEYAEGATAASNGVAISDCPYEDGEQRLNWQAGWQSMEAKAS